MSSVVKAGMETAEFKAIWQVFIPCIITQVPQALLTRVSYSHMSKEARDFEETHCKSRISYSASISLRFPHQPLSCPSELHLNLDFQLKSVHWSLSPQSPPCPKFCKSPNWTSCPTSLPPLSISCPNSAFTPQPDWFFKNVRSYYDWKLSKNFLWNSE